VWDLDADATPHAPGARGQIHALMLDNELPSSSDRVSIRHYRARVECPEMLSESSETK